MNKLPPLKSLRYFLAAARKSSLTLAAADMNVTQSAISHQISSLEEWLGAPLFVRTSKRLELTESGRQLIPDLERAFSLMERAIEKVAPRNKPLVVTTLPSFAAKWLVPRLLSFRRLYPGIDVHLSTTSEAEDIANGAADVGVRYGPGHWQGLEAIFLAKGAFFPVCSPGFLKEHGGISNPGDMLRLPLLGDPDTLGRGEETWRAWAALAGVKNQDVDIVLHFDTNALMLQAALDGLGVGLSNELMCGDDLRAGRLVRLFDVTLKSNFDYYLVYSLKGDERITAFANWVTDAIKNQ